MPKVSVIIPVYNIEKYLQECLDSVVNQTLKDIQIILIDDGSTDRSGEICQNYAEKYSFIEYYYKENGGSASARNLGLEYANGEYIGFIDSDDWVEKDMYQKLYDTAKNEDADIIFCRVFEEECSGADDYYKLRAGYYSLKDMEKEIYPYIMPAVMSAGNFRNIRWCNWLRLYKKEIIEKNNIRFYEKSRRCEDLGFSVASTLHAQSYYVLDESLYHNRPNAGSKSRNYTNNMWASIQQLLLYLKDVTDECKEYNFENAMNICCFYFVTMVIRNEMHLKDKKLRREKIKEIISDPICRNAVKSISDEGMNREYKGLYLAIKSADEMNVIKYMENLNWKKESLYPFLSKIISLPGLKYVYKKIRNRG